MSFLEQEFRYTLQQHTFRCEISGFHGGKYEILGYSDVSEVRTASIISAMISSPLCFRQYAL
jgi:hypothetical protein